MAGELPHQTRVRAEAIDLAGKLDALEAFLDDPRFNELAEDEKERLLAQAGVMSAYLHILETRIKHFS